MFSWTRYDWCLMESGSSSRELAPGKTNCACGRGGLREDVVQDLHVVGPSRATFALSPSWSDGVTRDMELAGEEIFECDTREGSGGVRYELADGLQVRNDFTEGTVKVVGSTGTRE